jgi:hypothetical protein
MYQQQQQQQERTTSNVPTATYKQQQTTCARLAQTVDWVLEQPYRSTPYAGKNSSSHSRIHSLIMKMKNGTINYKGCK